MNIRYLIIFIMLPSVCRSADLYFNPQFFLDKGEKIDLSIYEKKMQPEGSRRVDIYINNIFIDKKNINFIKNTHSFPISGNNMGLYPCINEEYIKDLGIQSKNIKLNNKNCVIINSINKYAKIKYNFLEEKLYLDIPLALIEKNKNNRKNWNSGINAAFINYDLNTNIRSGFNQYFLSLDSGINLGKWHFRSRNTYAINDYKNNRSFNWNNINNYVERAIPEINSNLIIGNNYTSNTVFDSLSFTGIKLFSANEMLPPDLRGFAPEVSGIAQTPSKITIRQNGNIIYQSFIPAGPFNINDLNSIGSNGDLDVTLEGDNGNIQIQKIPFSVLPIFQRPKMFDYEITIGNLRNPNDIQNNPTFIQGTLKYGLNNYLTTFGGLQISPKYRALNLGIGTNLGKLGAFSLDITNSFSSLPDGSKPNGQSFRFLYSKNLNNYGTSINLLGYRYSNKGFYTFNDTTYKNNEGYSYTTSIDEFGNIIKIPYSYYNISNTSKGSYQISLSQNMSNFGSLSFSKSSQSYWGTNKNTNNTNINYTKTFKNTNLSLSYNRSETLGFSRKENSFLASLSFSLDDFLGIKKSFINNSYINGSYIKNQEGENQFNLSLSGSALEDNKLKYNLNKSFGNNQNYFNAGLSLNSRYNYLSASYSKFDSYSNVFASLRGGILFHNNGITFGQSLGDTTILVKAENANGIKINNQENIKTDHRGYAIIPYAEAYRKNNVSLDINSLDYNIDIENNINSVVPIKGAIVLTDFNTQIGYKVLAKISQKNTPIPFGSIVTNLETGSKAIVGDNGNVYLTGLSEKGELKVENGENNNLCHINYYIPKNDKKHSIIFLDLDCN